MKKLSVLLSLFILSLAVICPASAAVNPSLRTDVLFCIAEKANDSGGYDNVVALFNKDDANIQKNDKTAAGWDISFTRDDPKSKGRIRSFRMPDGENRFIYTEFKSGFKDKIKLFNPNISNYATPSDLAWDDAAMLTGTPATHGNFLYFAGRDNCIIYKADMTNKCALSEKIDLNTVPGFDEIKTLCGPKKAHVMRLATLENTM